MTPYPSYQSYAKITASKGKRKQQQPLSIRRDPAMTWSIHASHPEIDWLLGPLLNGDKTDSSRPAAEDAFACLGGSLRHDGVIPFPSTGPRANHRQPKVRVLRRQDGILAGQPSTTYKCALKVGVITQCSRGDPFLGQRYKIQARRQL